MFVLNHRSIVIGLWILALWKIKRHIDSCVDVKVQSVEGVFVLVFRSQQQPSRVTRERVDALSVMQKRGGGHINYFYFIWVEVEMKSRNFNFMYII